MGETIVINATRVQVEDFKESVLWADIVRELEAWSEGFRREQDGIVDDAASTNPTTASVLLHMGDLNGRRKAVEYFIGILDVFLSVKDEPKSKEVSNGSE